jgi:hypothetical protein
MCVWESISNLSFSQYPTCPKLKLVNPSQYRFEHLVTQMKWRLQEGRGEAVYQIGVEDNGLLVGLAEEEMRASLKTLHRMAEKYVFPSATSLAMWRTTLGDRVVTQSPRGQGWGRGFPSVMVFFWGGGRAALGFELRVWKAGALLLLLSHT